MGDTFRPSTSMEAQDVKILTEEYYATIIFDHCSARSLVVLLRTCRSVNHAVRVYMTRSFSIERILQRYFFQTLPFRYLQARTGCLVSGSSALQFFDRSFYPDSDLDLYVSKGWAYDVGTFLLQEGYKFVRTSSQHPTFGVAVQEDRVATATAHYGNFRGISAVFTFQKRSKDGTNLKVQVMAAVRSPMEVILRFHSSTLKLN